MGAVSLDFAETTILLKTDAVIGSDKVLRINFQDGDKTDAGNFQLVFSDPPKYGLSSCTSLNSAKQALPVALPAQKDGFRVIKIEEHGTNGLKISCNDVELFTF